MHILGKGILTWPVQERTSDRYGCVFLLRSLSSASRITLDQIPAGARGSLIASVIEVRRSGHIGDLFRGVFPQTPEVGERVELGSGTLFFDDGCAGLVPLDGGEQPWLDVHALYRAHEQTVELIFEPDQ